MKKIYCVISGGYRIFKKSKISYNFENTLVLSIIWSKCENEHEKIPKGKESHWEIKNSWFNWKYIVTLKHVKKI